MREVPSTRQVSRRITAIVLGGGMVLGSFGAAARPAWARADSSRSGGPGGTGAATSALLVEYYETFLKDQDLDTFRQRVSSRYTEADLSKLAAGNDNQAKRAAILGLGQLGTMKVNEMVAQALADPDPVVRALAADSLWSIWFRADSAENNATLERVRLLIGRDEAKEAEELATKLIARAPNFAEAYNQRAIALFAQGRFADSAGDCRRVLERNPVHFGALSGLGQCYLRMGDRRGALDTFRRALKLQPHSAGLRQTVALLEAADA